MARLIWRVVRFLIEVELYRLQRRHPHGRRRIIQEIVRDVYFGPVASAKVEAVDVSVILSEVTEAMSERPYSNW